MAETASNMLGMGVAPPDNIREMATPCVEAGAECKIELKECGCMTLQIR